MNYSQERDRLRMETAERCMRVKKRLQHPFGLSTALFLQGIELPRTRRIDENKLWMVANHKNESYRLRDANFTVWPAPLQIMTFPGCFSCTSPACTWVMYARFLTLEELIVLGESTMRRGRGIRLSDLRNYMDLMESWQDQTGRSHAVKGLRRCRQAVRFLRAGTDSPQETRLRLLMIRYGLPEPAINQMIRDSSGRKRYLDLSYPQWNVAIEYDGMLHAEQWLADTDRRASIEDLGWTYIQVTKRDLATLYNEHRLMERIVRAIAKRTPRPPAIGVRLTCEQLLDGRRLRALK